MKKYMLIALPIIGVSIIGLFTVFAHNTCTAGVDCSADKTITDTKTQTENLSLDTIKRNLGDGALLVDVRTADEYAIEHAVGAINLPVERISSGEYPTADKGTTFYVYCRSGKRANTALEAMKKAGYRNVISIISLDNWKSLGGETLKS